MNSKKVLERFKVLRESLNTEAEEKVRIKYLAYVDSLSSNIRSFILNSTKLYDTFEEELDVLIAAIERYFKTVETLYNFYNTFEGVERNELEEFLYNLDNSINDGYVYISDEKRYKERSIVLINFSDYSVLNVEMTRYIAKPLTTEELKLYDSLGFTLDKKMTEELNQRIDDWFWNTDTNELESD